MSETLTDNGAVAAYLAAVRDALTDLDPADRDDLLEDLEAHLHEVVTEAGGISLEASLGSPSQYAAELRASAGLEPVPTVLPPRLVRLQQRVAGSGLWSGFGAILQQPWVRGVRDFLPTLRPGWWVLRGWLAVFFVVVWLHGDVRPYRSRL